MPAVKYFNFFLFLTFSGALFAEELSDAIKKNISEYKLNQKLFRASIILEPTAKALKLAAPDCRHDYLKDKISHCELANCFHRTSFMGTDMLREVIVETNREDSSFCSVKTPEKHYRIKKILADELAEVFYKTLIKSEEESFDLLSDVAKEGSTTRKHVYSGSAFKCEFNISYRFALDKTTATEFPGFKPARDGLIFTKEDTGKSLSLYVENGKAYKQISKSKKVFFYPKVKSIEPLKPTAAKDCKNILNLTPYVLEMMDQVEFIPPPDLN